MHVSEEEREIKCSDCETTFTIISPLVDEIEYCPFCGADIYLAVDDEEEWDDNDDDWKD